MTGRDLAPMLAAAITADPDALDALADRLAPLIAERIAASSPAEAGWLDTKAAAKYLGMTPNALRKRMHEIRSEQDVAGGKRWFKRVDLDAWREGQRFQDASIGAPRAA